MKVKLKNIQEFSENMKYSFAEPFIQIIKFELKHYEGNTQKRLKSFLEEKQRYGWPGSTWVLWTSFEQFCSNIYNNIFKNK